VTDRPTYPVDWNLVRTFLGPSGETLLREQVAIEEAEVRLEAIAGPEAAPALIDRARREYRRLVDAAIETPYEATRLSTILRSYVRTIARGEQP
jgi:hypothetical protein